MAKQKLIDVEKLKNAFSEEKNMKIIGGSTYALLQLFDLFDSQEEVEKRETETQKSYAVFWQHAAYPGEWMRSTAWMESIETAQRELERIKKNSRCAGAKVVERTETFQTVEECGYWVSLTDCSNAGVYCSVCHKKVYKEDYAWCNRKNKLRSDYCPHCGAKMMPQPPEEWENDQ